MANDVKAVFRMGVRGNNARPLMIQFLERTTKNLFMTSLYKLGEAEERFRTISVAHDMTKKEREDIKKLVSEGKAKQEEEEEGNFVWRVRGLPGQMRLVRLRRQ